MRSLAFALMVLVGCGDDTVADGGLDASSRSDAADDVGSRDSAASDTSSADGALPDGSSTDAPSTDALLPDTSTDAAVPDAAIADAGDDAGRDAGCTYIDDLYISDCEAGYERVRRFFSTTEPDSCPDYFVIAGERFTTLGEAMLSRSCAEACLRAPRNSFTIIRCERRTGYISFVDDEGCTPPSVIETSDGIFADADEWNTAFPCM